MDLLKEYNIINKSKHLVKDDDPNGVMQVIQDLGLAYFDDGLLGSTNHGVGYYYDYEGENANDFIGNFNDVKDKLQSKVIDKEDWEDDDDINLNDITNFFKKYKGTYVIKSSYDNTNYSRIDVDPVSQTVTIYALPLNNDGIDVVEFTNDGSQLILNPNTADYIIAG